MKGKIMDVNKFSINYNVRKLDLNDVDIIFELCSKNQLFYQYHPPFVSKASILEDMSALPPNKEDKDKLYIGFFEEEVLVAIMDLILAYPDEKTVYIGLFMTNVNYQGRNIGSCIIEECLSYLKASGYQQCKLAVDQGNPQSAAFWTKNKFVMTGEVSPHADSAYLSMIRML